MQVKWKKLLTQITLWLVAEIILNLLGLDNLADYGEFVFDKEAIVSTVVFNLTN
jgi:preprotein translocase subunit SecG